MWPFRRKAVPPRSTPTIPYIGAEAWALGGSPTFVDPRAAQACATVLACTNLISESIASLPATVTLADDTREEVPGHPLAKLIGQGPGPNETWSDMLTAFVSSALLYGNGALEIEANGRGQLSGLRSIAWPTVTPWAAADGSLCLDVLSMLPPNAGQRRGQRRTLLRGDFVYMKDRGDDALLGVSRLSRAANAVQLALSTQSSAYQFAANASRPAGTLNAPGKVSKETASRLAEEWDSNYSGSRKGKTAVLPEGLEWKALGLFNADDLQVVERLRYSVEDISRIFGVPLFLLGDPNRATYASAAAAIGAFQQSLVPWVAKIERAFAQSLLAPRYRLSLDLGAMLRADPESMSNAIAKLRQAGTISPNDARAMIGLPASGDPLADSLAPPNTSAAAAGGVSGVKAMHKGADDGPGYINGHGTTH